MPDQSVIEQFSIFRFSEFEDKFGETPSIRSGYNFHASFARRAAILLIPVIADISLRFNRNLPLSSPPLPSPVPFHSCIHV